MRQSEVHVPAGKSNRHRITGIMACALHQAYNWLILADCSNAFNNFVNRTAVLADVATYLPCLTPFAVICCRGHRMRYFERARDGTGRSLAPSGCSKGALWDRRFSTYETVAIGGNSRREEECGSLRYLDDVTLALMLVTASAAVRVIRFLRRNVRRQ